ncbi:putative membrane protein [Geomicrobium halophilum]|uniref:Putative membrane protein n=1 Tax=Geomicrobium halophilum TaxID=549000 RepID=A0A841PKY8_9BACL|nr:LiaF domain-containing protein [Geomicrobium halophilum]MBB6449527.1 putative membrane protein [Geomicrobium halophilum]
MERRGLSISSLTFIILGLIFQAIFAGSTSAFGFIVPFIFAVVAAFFVVNAHEGGAYLFMLLSAGVMVGYWTTIATWIFLIVIPVLFLLIIKMKQPVEEIDVDRDFPAQKVYSEGSSDPRIILPRSKWVILNDYKIKKQAFSVGDELELNVILGSAKIDLERALMDGELMDLSLMNVLGDTTIKLPEKWSATVEMNTLLGSVKALGHQEDGIIQRSTIDVGHPASSFGHFNIKINSVLGDVKVVQKRRK